MSHTKASSGPDGSKATANSLELPDGSAVAGGSGNKASDSGTLLGAGDTPLQSGGGTAWDPQAAQLYLALAPWAYKTTGSAGSDNSAQSTASLATLALGGTSGLFVDVLHSDSQSSYNSSSSNGSTTSYGAHVVAGGKNTGDGQDCKDNSCVSLYLLYAHTDTSGSGTTTQVANLNGNGVVTNKDVGGQCVIPLSPLATISCVEATGGAGQAAAADVAHITSQSGLPEVALVSGASNPAAKNGANTAVKGVKVTKAPAQQPAAVAPEAATNGSLPFTGFNAALAALVGAGVAAGGFALRRVRRTTA